MQEQDQAKLPLDDQGKIAQKLRRTARSILLPLAILAFLFSLFSGAEEAGGIIENSPNTLPWLGLILFVLIAWKWELVGGFLIVAMGVFSIFFFNVFQRNSWPVLFLISLPLFVLGGLFIGAWGLSQGNNRR